jgi:hypothetical protein
MSTAAKARSTAKRVRLDADAKLCGEPLDQGGNRGLVAAAAPRMGGQPLDVAPHASEVDEPGRQVDADRRVRRTSPLTSMQMDTGALQVMIGQQLLRIRHLVLRHSITPELRTRCRQACWVRWR